MFDCMPHEPGKLMVQRDSTSCGLLEALPFSNALSTAEWNVSQGQVPPCHHAIPPSPPLPLAGPSSARPSCGERGPPRQARAGVQRTRHASIRPSSLFKAPLRNAHFKGGKKRSGIGRTADGGSAFQTFAFLIQWGRECVLRLHFAIEQPK